MKIGITGGTGLLGSVLVNHALADDHKLVIFTRNKRNPSVNRSGGLTEYRYWEPITGHMDPIDDLDVLINLAGSSIASWPMDARRKEKVLSSRIQSGELIVEQISQASRKPEVLIQASAIGAYGLSEQDEYSEGSPFGTDQFAKICSEWEASTQAVEDMGVRRVVSRIGLVIHPDGGFLKKLELPYSFYLGGPLGSGRQWYSWIHTDDFAQAIFFTIADANISGVVNITAPNPVRMDDFGRILAKVIQRPHWLPVPGFALKIMLGELSALVLEGQKVMPTKLLEGGFEFRYKEFETALKNIYP